MRTWKLCSTSVALVMTLAAGPVWAQYDHAGHDHAEPAGTEHTAAGDEQAEHDHAASHDHGHVPHFSDINWMYGLLGEKEGVEPSLLFRPPGTPVPLGALLINTAILFFLIGRFGGPGIRQGLVNRKARIAGDIDRAAKMKAEAEEQLAYYEEKLATMEAEMARIKEEIREQAEADRVRILKEASQRRSAMEQETKELVAQKLAQARSEATLKAVSSAVDAARAQVVKQMRPEDQERLAKEFLGSLASAVKKTSEARS